MKIIFDANPIFQNKKSGVGYFTNMLIKAMADGSPKDTFIGHSFNFLNRKNFDINTAQKNISFIQSTLIPTKIINIGRRLGFQLPYELFTRHSSDVALFTNFVAMPTIASKKKVSVIYDISFIDVPQYAPERLVSYLKRWVPYTLKSSDLVVVNSSFTKSRIIAHYKYPSNKIAVVPIPPAEHIEPDLSIITKHGLGSPFLLFVGTIEPRKNIINLVKGYSNINSKLREKYTLVLAGGKGWKDAESLDLIRKLQKKGVNIILTGYISDAQKAALYQNAAICVQPSLYEGFGMPILEAMSYGKPIVCSSLAVFYEVAGDAAEYFDADNPDELTLCLERILSDKYSQEKLAKKSKKHIQDYPTWQQVAQNLHHELIDL